MSHLQVSVLALVLLQLVLATTQVTITSEHIRFYFSVFLFLHFLVVVSVQ